MEKCPCDTNGSQVWQAVVALWQKHSSSLFTLCPVYDGNHIAMPSMKMGPGSHGGHLGSTVSISSLSRVGLAREQVHTMGTYMSDPDGLINSVICFHGLQSPK